MEKYSILIIGFRCYYGHVREFVTNLKKKNPHVEITLALPKNLNYSYDELYPYVKQLVTCDGGPGSLVGKLPNNLYLCYRYMFFYYHFIKLGLKGGFDIINIHFANSSIIPYLPLLKRMTKNIVISPWGSDVLRVETDKDIKDLKTIYSYAKKVTIGRDTMIGKYLISKLNVSPEKLVDIGWGGESFDYIEENQKHITTEKAKERFGLKGRFVITCGYNMQKEQRHENIIDAINVVRDQLPENLTLLFLYTYGRNASADKYIDTLAEKCKKMGFDYLAIKDHLDMPDLLRLRMATDIFVHVQTSDAGSRCVAEYILCNKKVIHGAWMNYKYLEKKPSCFFSVNRMEELSECILKAYRTQIDDLPQDVRSAIMERSWNNKMILWNNFFESLAC